MPRTHFYHTVLWKNPTTDVVEPLDNVQAIPMEVDSSGLETETEGVYYASRTGGTSGNNLTDEDGVISFYLDVGDYNVVFSDLEIPARIGEFRVGVNSASGNTQLEDIDDVSVLQGQVAALMSQVTALQGETGTLSFLIPTGMIVPYGAATLPVTSPSPLPWLMCDGSAQSRSIYADLWNLITDTYGAGNGSTTFNMPDLRGRVPAGAGTPTGDATSTGAWTLGEAGGAERHALTAGQSGLPNHQHGGTTAAADRSLDHLHGASPNASYPYMTVTSFGIVPGWSDINTGYTGRSLIGPAAQVPAIGSVGTTGAADRSIDHLHGFATDHRTANASEYHSNLQAYATVNFMIKT